MDENPTGADGSTNLVEPLLQFEVESQSVRDLLAMLEMAARASMCLVLPSIGESGMAFSKLPRQQGCGTYLEIARGLEGKVSEELWRFCQVELKASSSVISNHSIRDWRNNLSHGGLVPTGFDIDRLRNRVDEVLTAYNEAFSNWTVIAPDDDGMCASCSSSGNAIANPLVVAAGSRWGFWHKSIGGGPSGIEEVTYFMVDSTEPELLVSEPFSERFAQAHTMYIDDPKEKISSRDVRNLLNRVKSDILEFRDSAFPIEIDVLEESLPIAVTWYLQKSDGAVKRTDLFDIRASDGARRWLRDDAGSRVATNYREFIKNICFWDVLGERIRARAEEFSAAEHSWSNEQFGELSAGFNVDRRVRIGDTIGVPFGLGGTPPIGDVRQLVTTIDLAVDSESGMPQVFFFAGEAGIGKTFTLRSAARDRAQEICNGAGEKPLFLYIDCAGIQLSSLKEAIGAATADTLILNPGRVFVLCRNGLMALLIDGFDELLGGAGYRDALQVMDSVFKNLGTSGTMVLSARSAYLANQYRRSIDDQERVGNAFTPVTHQMLNLEPWSLDEVARLFESRSGWSTYANAFTPDEMALLGIPFFARVFDGWIQKGERIADKIDLVWLLLEAYLEREVSKLRKGHVHDVSPEQLRDVFMECCVEMFRAGAEDLDEEEFLLCAGAALDRDFGPGATARDRNLANRMSVLSGVSAGRDSELSAVRFKFDHRIYYESLLAEYFVGRLNRMIPGDIDLDELRVLFGREEISDKTIAAVVSQVDEKVLRGVLVSLAGAGHLPGSVGAKNVGQLYSRFLEAGRSAPVRDALNIRVPTLDMKWVDGDVNLVSCEVGELRLRMNRPCELRVGGGRIESLVVTQSDPNTRANSKFLVVDDDVQIGELQVLSSDGSPISYRDSYRDILEELEKLGCASAGLILTEYANESAGDFETFVLEVLRKMSVRRSRSFVVEDRSNIPGDTAPHGLHDPTNRYWGVLVRLLTSLDLAGRKRLNASGVAKSIISFKVGVEEVLHHLEWQFWNEVRAVDRTQ